MKIIRLASIFCAALLPLVQQAQAKAKPVSTASQVSGRVYSSGGVAISGASVQIGSSTATSGSDGSYSITGLTAGTYPVTVSATGYTTLSSALSVPASAQLTQNFTLTPSQSSSSSTSPSVTSITTQYSPNGDALYFLEGVTFPVTFTATVGWGTHPAGTVQFLTPNDGIYSVNANGGNTVSQQIDVGSAFGLGGQLQVQAISSDGTSGVATVANFVVMPAIPNLIFQLEDRGNNFYYQSTLGANLQFFNDFLPSGVSVNSNIPIFGDNPFGLEYVPSLNTTVNGNNVNMLLQLSSSNFPSLDVGPFEFDLTPELNISGTYIFPPGQWQWSGTIGVNAEGGFQVTSYLPVPVPVPIYASIALDLSADAGFSVSNLYPVTLIGTGDFDPTLTGALGAGIDGLLAVEGWVSGGVDLTFQYPPQPQQTALIYYEIEISGGVTVYALLWSYTDQLFAWDWPSQPAPLALFSEPSSLQPYPRNYLKNPSYGLFHGYPKPTGVSNAGVEPQGITPTNTTENPALYALQTDVFPYSEPSISANGTNCYAVWLYDNQSRSANNQTMLVFSEFDGSEWSDPVPVADDGTADFHPQLKEFPDGSAVVAWENEGAVLSSNANFTAMLTNMEIATAFYDPVAGQWQPMQQLTTNNYLDRTPRIAGPSENNLMLVWVANTNNDIEGSDTNVNQLVFTTWDGSAWSTLQIFASVPYPLIKYDLSYDGTNAFVVMSLDSDNTLTNVSAHELFEVAYQNGSWGGLTQLTTNQVPNDNPQMAIDPYGNIVLAWLQGNTLSSVVNFNFTNQQVMATNHYSCNLADFKLANSIDGRLAIVWAQPSPQYPSDLYGMFYDPIFDVWGNPKQLTDDPETELETAATFYSTNQLIALYDRVDISTNEVGGTFITNADLYVLQYQLTNNLVLAANSLTVSPANPAVGDTVTLSVTAENLGDSGVSNVLVVFYQGDPTNDMEIGETNLALVLVPGATNVVSIPWTVPATTNSLVVYAVIDPDQQYPESDLQNEVINNTFVEQDLAVQSVTWGQITSNLLSITATVINQGAIPSQPATVNFLLNSLTGTNLFSTNIVSLTPGQSIGVNFIWNVSNLGNGLNLFAVVNSGTNALDFNPQNNTLQLTLEPNITQVNVQLGPATVLSNGLVQVSITGLAGQTYVIEVSTNQTNWSTLTEVTLTNGSGQFLDTSTNDFYQAVVLSQAQPQLGAPQFSAGGTAQVLMTGLAGQTYIIEASADLINWTPIMIFSATNSQFYFSDPSARNYTQRFYRAILLSRGYVAPPIPVVLGFGSAQPLTTNGFNLMLQGTIGSNYVIQASTDLVNWQTITNFVSTTSPVYFSDPAATNFSQRFYQVVMQ